MTVWSMWEAWWFAPPDTAMEQAEIILSVEGLQRNFGAVQAVRGVSFHIRKGHVVGFIGANGAGKTTTMRVIATLDNADAGSVSVAGYDTLIHPQETRRRLGWMPDYYGTYTDMTVWEYLDFFARAYGYKGAERRRRVDEVMAFTDLDVLAERPMNTLSKGMGQRLCLGRALVHDPDVLILDEPAAGLDPKARIEFKHLVRLLAVEGKTLFISSHILSELGEMCDDLLFIDNGRIVHQGSPESLNNLHARPDNKIAYMVKTTAAGREPLRAWALLQPDVTFLEERKDGALLELECGDEEAVPVILKRALDAGLPVTAFFREQRRLEDAFVDLVDKLNNAGAPPPPPILPGVRS